MDELTHGDLRIERLADHATPTYCWKGKSNERNPTEILRPFFRAVLTAAAGQAQPVEMHFEQLEHFNSSTISAIIQLVQEAKVQGVKLVLVYDQKLKWQKLSFDALRVFVKADQMLELRAS